MPTSASPGPNLNTPGDGKFDPSNVTGISGPNQTIELGFGRIDFSLALTSELDATLHYLRKLHRYKIADASFAPGRAALIRSGYDAVEEAGWGSLPAIVGPASLRTLDVAALPSDPFGRLDGDALIARDSGPFLFYFRGNGQPSHAPSARAVFWTGMQSNWGYWYNNSTMPSRLAEDNWALSFTWQIWGTRYAYHRLSLGAHTGGDRPPSTPAPPPQASTPSTPPNWATATIRATCSFPAYRGNPTLRPRSW